MNWKAFKLGLLDELEKISAISTRGLSTETIMGAEEPQPMETTGFQVAKSILDRAQMLKTAASKQIQRALPRQPGLGKLIHQGDDSASEKAKSVGGYGLAGLGTGKAIHSLYSSQDKVHAGMRHPDLSHSAKYVAERANNTVGRRLMVGGAVAGLGYGAYRAVKKSRMAKEGAAFLSPGASLKASRQVGATAGHALGKGPSLKSQSIGTIGSEGRTL